MNPGPTEEIGNTARLLLDVLRGSPGVLALVVFNLIFVGFVWHSTNEERLLRTKIVEQEGALSEKLLQCIPLDALSSFLEKQGKP